MLLRFLLNRFEPAAAPRFPGRPEVARPGRGWVALLALWCLAAAPLKPGLAQSSLELEHTWKTAVGWDGSVRLGRWNPLVIEAPADDPGTEMEDAEFEISTVDGDDEDITYRGALIADPDRPGRYLAWFRPGRPVRQIQLRLRRGQASWSRTIDLPEERLLDAVQPLLGVVESRPQLAQAVSATLSLRGASSPPVVKSIGQAADLPWHWIGYDPVETIVLTTEDSQMISELTPQQLEALEDWIERGGRLIFSGSVDAPRWLAPDQPLARFVPGTWSGMGQFTNSSRLESYAESRDPLIPVGGQPIPLSTFSQIDGTVGVSDGQQQPLVISQARGLGQITLVTFDLQSPRLVEWPSYASLVRKLVAGNQVDRQEQATRQTGRGSSVTHYGFTDLAGQLRVPLDSFSRVQFVAFTWIALLIGLYILCIGPLDYFLLRSLLRKMELTWITFPLFSILFCLLAIGISGWTRPAEVQMNQLEIIDVDAVSGRCRGSVWTTLYSPQGQTVDIQLGRDHGMGFQIDQSLVTWQGLPGDGLGGMQSRSTPKLHRQGYQTGFGASAEGPSCQLESVPLQVSSSKAFFSQWFAPLPVDIRSRPRFRARSGRVTGAIKNPFDFELSNCRLYVDNWAYVLDEPLGPGETFDIQTGASEKTLKSVLTRRVQQADKENRGLTSPWDPTTTRVTRIADMLMFYQAAGGEAYTGLTHGYQPQIDLSDHLGNQRAILVGEVERTGAALALNPADPPATYDRVTTLVRIILPVITEEDESR